MFGTEETQPTEREQLARALFQVAVVVALAFALYALGVLYVGDALDEYP